jgi:hypothetical protein
VNATKKGDSGWETIAKGTSPNRGRGNDDGWETTMKRSVSSNSNRSNGRNQPTFWSGMLVSVGVDSHSQLGVLKSRCEDEWRVTMLDGTEECTSAFESRVIKRSDDVEWGDSCTFCGLEIDAETLLLPDILMHDVAGNSNCPHKFHLKCLAEKVALPSFLTSSSKLFLIEALSESVLRAQTVGR